MINVIGAWSPSCLLAWLINSTERTLFLHIMSDDSQTIRSIWPRMYKPVLCPPNHSLPDLAL